MKSVIFRIVLLFLLASHAQADIEMMVAADGSSTVKMIQEAVDSGLQRNAGSGERLVIRLKPGRYRERVVIPKDSVPVTLLGENAETTRISYGNFADFVKPDGQKQGTFDSATFFVLGNDFLAENITFENTYGQGSQALALHVGGDRAVFRKCRFLGWQDTILLKEGRQYFEDCMVEGHVDFIFGGATAWFERCEIHALAKGAITAASTSQAQAYGFVFHQCRVTAAADKKWETMLGRPWRPHASVTFLRTHMAKAIAPVGWYNWNTQEREKTVRYAEFKSSGPGGKVEGRVAWSRQLTEVEAQAVTLPAVLGGSDGWLPMVTPPPLLTLMPIGAFSPERMTKLPPDQQKMWRKYLEHSEQKLAADKAVLEAEMESQNLAEPLPAPNSGDFKLPSKLDAVWFCSDEAQQLADIVLSYQTPSGGWSKHTDYTKGLRSLGMHWSSQANGLAMWHYVGTFDNRATTEQLRLLAGVNAAKPRQDYSTAFLRGLDFVLDAQFPTGGWPQVWPLEGGYHDNITFNDNAMTNILGLLQSIASSAPEFAFVDDARRARVSTALAAGLQCILASQYLQDEKRTVWCAQHDPITLAPAAARLKEPASLSGAESATLVKFLMRNIPAPSPEIVRSIEDALAWFEKSKLIGLSQTQREGRNYWQVDPSATEPHWARFYDLATNQPIFAGAQDGITYDSFEAMWRNNRFGYDFYVSSPGDLLVKERARWKKLIAENAETATAN